MEQTLKDQYWKNGYIFRFRDGDRRMVFGDKLIANNGYIPSCIINDELVNTDNVNRDRVVEIYKPNKEVYCLSDLVKCKELVWRRCKHLLTIDEIREGLGIPDSEGLIVIKE